MIDFTTLIIIGGIILVFAGLIVYLTQTLVRHRDFYDKRERWLISAIMAKDLPELANCQNALTRTPKDDLKQVELENELAIHAQELLSKSREQGIPI